MKRLTLPIALFLVLGLSAAADAGQCQFLTGPDQAVDIAADPDTGLLLLNLPVTIGQNTYNVDVTAAILGFLEVDETGTPRQALQTQTWQFQETGLRLEWTGHTMASATADPFVVDYTIRLDLADSSGGFGTGLAFVEGQLDLVHLTGYAENLFGRVCTGR